MYKYQFTSTVNDLLDAEEADTTRRTMRKPLRWAIAVIGAVGIAAALDGLRSSPYAWELIFGLLIGGYVVYYFAIASYVRGRRIRRGNPHSAEVVVEFRDDCLKIELIGYGTYEREWHELLDFTDGVKGILLYFDDGTVNWLPNRIFGDTEDREALIGFLRGHGS